MGRLTRTKPHFRAIFAICDDFEAISKLDFEAILMEFDFRENFTGKLGVRTAEEVIERFVLSPGQKVVIERSITWLKGVLEHLF